MEVSLTGCVDPSKPGNSDSLTNENIIVGPVSHTELISIFLGGFNIEDWHWYPPPPLTYEPRLCVCFILKSLCPPVTTSYCLILFHFPCCTWDFGRLFIGLSIISTQSASAVFCMSTVMDARRLNNEWEGKNVCVCMSDSDRALLNLHFLSSQWTLQTVFPFLKH